MVDWYNVADLVHRGPWWKNKGLVALNACIALVMLTSSINGFDSSVLNGLQIVPQWKIYFNHPSGTVLGVMSAAQNVGALLALPFAPFLSDGIGRRKTLFVGSMIMLGGVALQALSAEIVQFIMSRMMIGFGLCFATNSAPLLITELAYPTQRGPITALYNSSWYFGSIIAAWLTYGTYTGMPNSIWSWRIPSLVQAVPSLLQAALIWFVPESPRWLVAKGKEEEALAILAHYHANGQIDHPLVQFTFSQIREAIVVERELGKSSSFLSLFMTPGNRKRMRIIIAIGFFSQWSGNGLVSFYIDLILESIGIKQASSKALINGGLQLWNLIMAVTAALLVDRLGRRFLFLTSNTGMLVTFSMWTLAAALYATRDDKAAANAAIALMFLFYSFYDLAYTPLLVAYSVEVLPFSIRAKGFAVMNLTVCIALAVNQFINPEGIKKIGWYYYLVYCGWLVFELIFVYIYVVETKGKTLEETAALFDGEGHSENLQDIGNEAATQSVLRGRAMPPQHYQLQLRNTRESRERDEREKKRFSDATSRRVSAYAE